MSSENPACTDLRRIAPDDWEVCPLGSVTDFQEGPGILAKDFRIAGVPLLRLRNIESPVVKLDGCNFLDPAKVASKWRHFCLTEGDMLISTSASLGRVSVVGSEAVGSVAYTGIIRFRSSSQKLHHKYLRAFLSSAAFVQQAERMATGSVIKHFGPSHLRQMAITLPSVSVQKQIATIFDALDDRIILLRETNVTLEAIAQAIFKSWFVDFDPVRAKSQGLEPEGMDAETAALFPNAFEQTELGLVPKGWKVDFLENWIDVLETGKRPKGGVAGITGGIPSIGAESITKIGEFDFSKLKYVEFDFFEKMRSGKIESRDVLLYKDGGKPGVFLPRVSMFGDGFPYDKCGINEHVFRIRLKAPFNQTYLYFWLWSDQVMFELKHRGGKAAIPGINQGDVKELRIAIPSTKILNKFENITSPIISKIFSNSKSIKLLSDVRDTLLPRLISGQLQVPDAEQAIEKAKA